MCSVIHQLARKHSPHRKKHTHLCAPSLYLLLPRLPHRHPSLSSLLLPCLFRGMRLAGCVWWPDSKSLSHSPKKFPPFFPFYWPDSAHLHTVLVRRVECIQHTHTHTLTLWSHCWYREYQYTPLLFPPSEPLLWSISVCCGQQGVCAFAALPSKIQTFQGSQQYNMVALL